MTKFTYSTEYYFPNNIKFIGILFLLAGLILFTTEYFTPSLLFLFLGAFIFITKYGIEIDLDNKTYLDYLLLFGFKKGKTKRFDSIESIYITDGKKTTKMHLRGHATTISEKEYNGYMKFFGDEKVHLLSSTKKEDVEKLLTQMSQDLNVKLEDYSIEN